jgi:hypothetical protein
MGMTATVMLGGLVVATTSALAFWAGRRFIEHRLNMGSFDKHYEISVVAKRSEDGARARHEVAHN